MLALGQKRFARRLSVIDLDIIGLQRYEFNLLFANFLAPICKNILTAVQLHQLGYLILYG